MRILFSIYEEEEFEGNRRLYFSEMVETSMTLKEIDRYFDLRECFRFELSAGQTLAFWDIYCGEETRNDLIAKIHSLPVQTKHSGEKKDPRALRIQFFESKNRKGTVFPKPRKYYFYEISRCEMGADAANGVVAFCEQILTGVLTGILSTVIYDWMKRPTPSFSRYMGERPKTVRFEVRKFYRNFTQMVNVDRKDCQIIWLDETQDGNLKVWVRTLNNECYDVRATKNGEIVGMSVVPFPPTEDCRENQ